MVSEYRYHYHQLANCPFKADKVAKEKTFLLNVAQRLGPSTNCNFKMSLFSSCFAHDRMDKDSLYHATFLKIDQNDLFKFMRR